MKKEISPKTMALAGGGLLLVLVLVAYLMFGRSPGEGVDITKIQSKPPPGWSAPGATTGPKGANGAGATKG